MLPPPHFTPAAAFSPFGPAGPAQLIPTTTLTPPRHTFAAAFPPIFYWPYPSPPVSPTSYYGGALPPLPPPGATAAIQPPPHQHGAAPPPHHSAAATLVIMQGLPYSANTADVLNFFRGFPEWSIDYLNPSHPNTHNITHPGVHSAAA
ncbi:hypothetical protein L798_06710 [Zootermopsis nevadensis]|uniref:Uncharacterized protein n=2 Tax=Zootermopsis nevadensis TaxID=136037 RepID=A0A067RWG7_ZOONE|nr:hypothetical protein L798_06710 [Zootermopsis nevadensis]